MGGLHIDWWGLGVEGCRPKQNWTLCIFLLVGSFDFLGLILKRGYANNDWQHAVSHLASYLPR